MQNKTPVKIQAEIVVIENINNSNILNPLGELDNIHDFQLCLVKNGANYNLEIIIHRCQPFAHEIGSYGGGFQIYDTIEEMRDSISKLMESYAPQPLTDKLFFRYAILKDMDKYVAYTYHASKHFHGFKDEDAQYNYEIENS